MLNCILAAENAGISEVLADGLKVTAIGMLVVFSVLIVLVFFTELIHYLFKDRKKSIQTEKNDQKPAEVAVPEKPFIAGTVAKAPESVAEAAKDGAFIAAVSAAVSMLTGKNNNEFIIKSIKK